MAKPIAAFTREDEYETQFYGFCSKDLIEHMKSSLHEAILELSKALKNHLLEAQTSDEGKHAVDIAVSSLIEKCLKAFAAPMETLMEQFQTIFSLPPHILLPEDEVQRNRYTQEDEDKEKREIDRAKQRFRRAQYLKYMYQEELEASQLADHSESLDETCAQIRTMENWIESHDAKSFHKVVQDLLGAEVIEASLKLSEQPSCGESDIALNGAIITTTFTQL